MKATDRAARNATWIVRTNRHPTLRGDDWGWVEGGDGEHFAHWSGNSERLIAERLVKNHNEAVRFLLAEIGTSSA